MRFNIFSIPVTLYINRSRKDMKNYEYKYVYSTNFGFCLFVACIALIGLYFVLLMESMYMLEDDRYTT